MKIGLIGAGNVGAACLQALAIRSVAREIVLVNRTSFSPPSSRAHPPRTPVSNDHVH